MTSGRPGIAPARINISSAATVSAAASGWEPASSASQSPISAGIRSRNATAYSASLTGTSSRYFAIAWPTTSGLTSPSWAS